MPWVLQVADLFVHGVNDLEVCLFLALIQALQVGRFAGALLCVEQTFVFGGIGSGHLGLRTSLLSVFHGDLGVLSLAHLTHLATALASLVQRIVTDDDLARRASPTTSCAVLHSTLGGSSFCWFRLLYGFRHLLLPICFSQVFKALVQLIEKTLI